MNLYYLFRKNKMNINIILTFFGANLYLFLLVIPFFSQLWLLPIWAMFFIMFAGALAHNLLELVLLFSLVLVSTVSWDILGYIIGRKFYKFKFFRYLRKWKKTKNIYDKSKEYFDKKWEMAIFLSRFLITWIWPTINYIVWFQSFNFRKFTLYMVFWEILYWSELLLLGYIFKDSFEEISNILSNFWTTILIAFIMYEIWKYLFWKKAFKI
jgi:membrane protein DedA with SNARE-associated domain